MTGQREGDVVAAVDPRGQVVSGSAPNRSAGGARSAAAGEAGPGLVHYTTSHTEPDQVLINPKENRLKRMKRSVITSARLHEEQLQRGGFRNKAAMLTLTYRDEVEWNPKQISALTTHIRNWFSRRGHKAAYVWTLEYTKRGRPHYHIIFWLPKGLTLPKPDKQGWWPHGFTEIRWARNAVGYIAKYASKGTEQPIEKGARLHGCGGLDRQARIERRWWLAPRWVREWTNNLIQEVKRVKGGWLNLETGEFRESIWLAEWTPFGLLLTRKLEGVLDTC